MSTSKRNTVIPEAVPSMLKTYVKGNHANYLLIHFQNCFCNKNFSFFSKLFSSFCLKMRFERNHTIYCRGQLPIFAAFRIMFQRQQKIDLKRAPSKWSNRIAWQKSICVFLLNRWIQCENCHQYNVRFVKNPNEFRLDMAILLSERCCSSAGNRCVCPRCFLMCCQFGKVETIQEFFSCIHRIIYWLF